MNFYLQNYQKVIEHGNVIVGDKSFKNSNEKAAFAWSFYEIGDNDKAGAIFRELDVRFSNYNQRLEYAKYLKVSGNAVLANDKLQNLIAEIESMDNHERNLKRKIFKQIKSEYSKINT